MNVAKLDGPRLAPATGGKPSQLVILLHGAALTALALAKMDMPGRETPVTTVVDFIKIKPPPEEILPEPVEVRPQPLDPGVRTGGPAVQGSQHVLELDQR